MSEALTALEQFAQDLQQEVLVKAGTEDNPQLREDAFTEVVLERLASRHGSGGSGTHNGGAGMIRRIRVLAPCDVCFAAQRRTHGADGILGGADGKQGLQRIVRADGTTVEMPGIFAAHLEPGDAFEVETPGGGAWGPSSGH